MYKVGSPGENTLRNIQMLYDHSFWYLQIPNDNVKQGFDLIIILMSSVLQDFNLWIPIFNFSYMINYIKLNFYISP